MSLAVRQEFEARAAQSMSGRLAPFLTQTPSYMPGRYRAYVKYGYLGNELIYSGLKLITQVFAQGQLQVENQDESIIVGHPLRQRIARPWKRSYEHELWTWTLLDMFLAGNAFWELVRSATGKIVEIRRLEPDRIGIVASETDYLSHYVYEVGGQWFNIPDTNVLHWKFSNPGTGDPMDQFFGVAPMVAIWKQLQADNEMTDFTKVVLQNYAIPGTVIEAEQSIDDVDAKEIKRKYKAAFGGKGRGDVFVAQKGMRVKVIGMDLQQLAFTDLRKISETRLLMALGGAPLVYLLGTSAGMDRAIYNNYSEAREALADDVVGPLWSQIEDAITAFLLPQFDTNESHYALFDTSAVVAFQERRNKLMKEARESLLAGMIGRDEARAMIKLRPIGRDGRDVIFVPIGVDERQIAKDGMVEDEPEEEPEEPDEVEEPEETDRGEEEPDATEET